MTEPPQVQMARAWAAHRPGLDVRPIEVFGRLRRLQELHDLVIGPLYEGAPVNQGEVAVLIFLRHAEEPTIARRLAQQRGCSAAAMGKILNRLEGRGLIRRRPNPHDRRAALVESTPEGDRVVDDYMPRQLAIEAALLEGLDEAWRDAFTGCLDELTDRMKRVVD